jgi:hypothetical protein
MKKKASKVNFETLKFCIGLSDLLKQLGRLDLSIKYDLLVRDKLHFNYNQISKLTMDFAFEYDVKLIDAQNDTSEKEKDNQINECLDWYSLVMKSIGK